MFRLAFAAALVGISGVIAAVCVASTVHGAAASEDVLYSFRGCCEDARFPQGGLIADSHGNLYGTSASGGLGFGTVFKLTPVGTAYHESVLYKFRGGADGEFPSGNLTALNGDLYGTTVYGGLNVFPNGLGTFFKLSLSANRAIHTVIYDFQGPPDAASPGGDLIVDPAGALYGVAGGGLSPGYGTVYKLTPNGATFDETVIYRFQSTADGEGPEGPLVMDDGGALYGVTASGGVYKAGTVFKIGVSHRHKILYSFQGGSDGSLPSAGIIADDNGAFYGVTIYGGRNGLGSVFRLEPNGPRYTKTTLYDFKRTPDGAYPESPLLSDGDGSLFGTTSGGGSAKKGALFKLTPGVGGYTETVVYSFQGPPDGRRPAENLIVDSSGALYGTTVVGGKDFGTVFKIMP